MLIFYLESRSMTKLVCGEFALERRGKSGGGFGVQVRKEMIDSKGEGNTPEDSGQLE
jgi:hypothetical protein